MLANWLTYVPNVANWASILSLFISAYAAYAITKVRAEVVGRIRLPSLVDALEKHGNSFAGLMLTYDAAETKDQFALELARCEANIRLIRSKINRAAAGRANVLLRRIAHFKGPRWFGYYPAANEREHAWRIYAELNGLIEELKNFVEEQRIGA